MSFLELSTKKKFRDQLAIGWLLKIFVEHSEHLQLQILIIKIIKYDIAGYIENQKQVAKILGDSFLISYFYPDLILKKSSLAKCFNSH